MVSIRLEIHRTQPNSPSKLAACQSISEPLGAPSRSILLGGKDNFLLKWSRRRQISREKPGSLSTESVGGSVSYVAEARLALCGKKDFQMPVQKRTRL